MVYLGIDIGKNTHVASLMDEKSTIIFKAFSFHNSSDGAASLLAKIEPHKNELEIGLEATGHYWLALYSYLVKQGFVIHVINPIQTDGWRKGTEIRKRKTDIIDSVLIADFIRYGDFLETSLADEDTMSLRNLSRFRNYLISSTGDLKRKTICVLDQVFPEYSSAFSNVFGKTSKELLLELSTPADYEAITSEQLVALLDRLGRKDFTQSKINLVSGLAKTSFGVTFCADSFALQLKLLIQQISFIEQQVADVELEIKQLLEKINTPITTVPGVGAVIAATILGEIGDLKRFSTASKLVAYAGLDSAISQSGKYESTSNHISKRGSSYLRKALYQAAFIAAFHDPVFKAFYEKKRREGKHHKVAIAATARKLCHTIFAVLKNDCPYQIQKQ